MADRLGTLPSSPILRGQRLQTTLATFERTSTQSLRKLQADTTNLALLHWIHLVEVHQQHRFDRYGQSLALADWQKRYPDHPASQYVLPALVADAPFQIKYPRQIALLLPVNSRSQRERRKRFVAALSSCTNRTITPTGRQSRSTTQGSRTKKFELSMRKPSPRVLTSSSDLGSASN
ncbi:MAG: hypothetical protein CM1200mP41_30600 [Gammaproteobacteria bacterium]|nr:MAG: hypothetical protein CM1200mP41_30600 [Gammaproteobacteria bacterium]